MALARARRAAARRRAAGVPPAGARRRRAPRAARAASSVLEPCAATSSACVATGAAYQFGDIVAKGSRCVTLPLYTRHSQPAGYGAAESLLTAVILASILLRVGVGEAFIRFYFDDEDVARRERIARTATATVAWTTTLAALLARRVRRAALAAAARLPTTRCCSTARSLGLWAFTNLEMAYAQLRVDERARTYVFASGANVALTVIFTVALVVVADQGARGLLLGNFAASAVVVLGLWWVLRRRFSPARAARRDLRAMLRFGAADGPADASVYALQVADRFYLFRGYSHAAAGLYSVAIKLATVVFVAVRGFQYAWPPLAYSIESDDEAARLYSLVTTYYVLATGVVVVRRRAARALDRAPAGRAAVLRRPPALPWLALGWALYGLYLVFVVIAGRARVTVAQLPRRRRRAGRSTSRCCCCSCRAAAGLGIAGAGIALCGAYVAMLVVMHLLTRQPVRRRLSVAPAGAAGGDPRAAWPSRASCCCRRAARPAIALRALWLALVPALLVLTRFFAADERSQARALLADGRRRVAAFRARRTARSSLRRGPAQTSEPRRSRGTARCGCSARPPRAGPRRGRDAASPRRGAGSAAVEWPGSTSARERAQRVRPGRQPAHARARPRAEWCLRMYRSRLRASSTIRRSGTAPVESCSWWTAARARHVAGCASRRRAGAARSRPRRSRRRSPGRGSRPRSAACAAHEQRRRLAPVDLARAARRRSARCTRRCSSSAPASAVSGVGKRHADACSLPSGAQQPRARARQRRGRCLAAPATARSVAPGRSSESSLSSSA